MKILKVLKLLLSEPDRQFLLEEIYDLMGGVVSKPHLYYILNKFCKSELLELYYNKLYKLNDKVEYKIKNPLWVFLLNMIRDNERMSLKELQLMSMTDIQKVNRALDKLLKAQIIKYENEYYIMDNRNERA